MKRNIYFAVKNFEMSGIFIMRISCELLEDFQSTWMQGCCYGSVSSSQLLLAWSQYFDLG